MVLGSGIRDPRSGKKHIPDPGSRGQKATGSRIRNTDEYKTKGSLPLRIDPSISCVLLACDL
jgi:hypothetical protein